MFGFGMLCWVALGSIVLARLSVASALPTALTPNLDIGFALRWVAIAPPPHPTSTAIGLLIVASLGIGALAARTILGLVHGTYLPRAPVPPEPRIGPPRVV